MTLEELELPERVKQVLLNQKRQEYKDYLNRHGQVVKNSWEQIKNKIINRIDTPLVLNDIDIKLAEELIENHDSSKFEEPEFEGYRQWWFPVMTGYEHDEELYKQSKELHRKANGHHWNHWVDKNDNMIEMPNIYICELLADWDATSRAEGNDDLLWYREQLNKGLIRFAPKTKEIIERCLVLLKTSRE